MKKRIFLYLSLKFLCFYSFGDALAEDITIDANTVWESGSYTYENVSITGGSTLTFNGKVTLKARSLTIDSDSSISADGRGYPAGNGPGAGGSLGGGGSYGGKGGDGYYPTKLTYGSAIAPVDLGSGGGLWAGGTGGGAIILTISESLIVDGKITVNGNEGVISDGYGGGSGGSIYITTKSLSGAGKISANGGNGPSTGSAGGGGRIAIYYKSSTFTGQVEAKQGAGKGEDGTICFVDTQNSILYPGHSFRFQANDGSFGFDKIVLNNSKVNSEGTISLTANSDFIIENNSSFDLSGASSSLGTNALQISNNSSLTVRDNCNIVVNNLLSITDFSSLSFTSTQTLNAPVINLSNGSNIAFSGKETLTINNINLNNNSSITHIPEGKISLNIADLSIDNTSSVCADGKGYPVAKGPGTGGLGVGGSYGGKGGFGISFPSGPCYGFDIAPEDLGSGGGNWGGGSGGGAIKLVISGILNIGGKITANGNNGGNNFYGGGSGGSVYIIANHLSGDGKISANGGIANNGKGDSGAGGGGGRIAFYYTNSTFTGSLETNGGQGSKPGQDGTIVTSQGTEIATFNLSEKTFNSFSFQAPIINQQLALNNITATGDLQTTVNFNNFELVKIDEGAFAGKGFFKSEVTVTLAGLFYNGSCKGIIYPDSKENRICLKGDISGDMAGIVDLTLEESSPGSGTFDKFQGSWKLNRVGSLSTSVALDLTATAQYQPAHTINSEVYYYQSNLEGNAYGFYTGPLNAVVTHLRLTGDNEYKNMGFSVMSYDSLLGQSDAFAYNELLQEKKVGFEGLFNEPILGKLSAVLDESKSPKTLSGTIKRIDLGSSPQPELRIKVWGPQRVSPGETVTYIIEYRNDGFVSATDTAVVMDLSPFMQYISASKDAIYSEGINEVAWDLGELPSKTTGYLFIQAEAIWGLPGHMLLDNYAFIENFVWHSDKIGTIRSGINLPRCQYLITECTGAPDQPGICQKVPVSAEELKQFKCPEFRSCSCKQVPQYESWSCVASKYNSSWQPILNTGGDPFGLADALHAALASPVFGDGEGNPIVTDKNGLSENYETKDYAIEYSGGGPCGDGALTLGKETISTTKAETKFTKYRVSPVLFDPEKLLTLYKQNGVKKVVLYQSEYDDLLDFNGNISYDRNKGWDIEIENHKMPQFLEKPLAELSGTSKVKDSFEQKTGKQIEKLNIIATKGINGKYSKDKVSIKLSGKAEPIEFYLQGNPKTGELFKQSDFSNVEGIEVEVRDRSKYKTPHTGWQTHILNEDILTGKIKSEESANNFFSKDTNEAVNGHDPNELIVSPINYVRPGDKLTYTINFENEGEGNVYGVYITDVLEENLDEESLLINGNGSYDPKTKTIKWFIGELASKQKGLVSFSVNVKSDAQDKSEVINFATVYFPSVPEETRTNGTVNRISTATDTTPPVTIASILPTPNSLGWNKTDVTVSLTASDNENGLGLTKTEYSLDNANWSTYSTPITITNEGTTTVYYRSIDNANNIELSKTAEIKIDRTLPVISASFLPQANSFGWNNSDVMVNFTASDVLSGLASVTSAQTVTTEGINQCVGGEAIDLADNHASASVILNIDKIAPQVSITSPQENREYFLQENIPLTCTSSDDLSKIESFSVVLDGIDVTGQGNLQPGIGNHLLAITAIDFAGNKITIERHFIVKLKVQLTLKPEVFLENNGIFIALVKFPSGYDIRTIRDATCDGAPSKMIILLHDFVLFVFRKEDITELTIDTVFTLRGHFSNNLLFEGTGTIKKIIHKGTSLKEWLKKMKDTEEEELKPYKTMANF